MNDLRERRPRDVAAWMLDNITSSKNNPPGAIVDGLFETFNALGVESRHKYREGCRLALAQVKGANTIEYNLAMNVLMRLRPQIEAGSPQMVAASRHTLVPYR